MRMGLGISVVMGVLSVVLVSPWAVGQDGGDVVTEPPPTSDRHLRDLLYHNVRHPGGTYSTQPLSESQNLDRPLAVEEGGAEAPPLQFLAQERFDGFDVFAVNDADLFLTALAERQREHVVVIHAGEIDNAYDLIIVDDALGVDVDVFINDLWAGAGRPYYQPLGTFYYSPCIYGYACTTGCCTGGLVTTWDYGPYYGGRFFPDVQRVRWLTDFRGLRRYDYRRYWGPIESSYSPQFPEGDQDTSTKLEPVKLSAIELGRALVRAERLSEAIEMYRAHLRADPDDAVALRMLGAALIEEGKVADGIATIRLAYGLDPALAGVPLDRGLFGSSKRLRDIVRQAVRAANEENSSSAWLAVVILMQAEGRDRVALNNLAKAEDQYLSEDIARALRRRLE